MRLNNPIPRRDFLQLSAGALAYSGLTQKPVDPRDAGARGDGHTLNTNALQKAIDQAAAAGGGVVAIPPGDFLTGGLVLRSHVTLHLEAGPYSAAANASKTTSTDPALRSKATLMVVIFSSLSAPKTSPSPVRASSTAAAQPSGAAKAGPLHAPKISGATSSLGTMSPRLHSVLHR